MGVHLTGMHLIGLYFMGVPLIDMYFMDLYIPDPSPINGGAVIDLSRSELQKR
jgi:hypothetical protein